jgi:hypothetical protein
LVSGCRHGEEGGRQRLIALHLYARFGIAMRTGMITAGEMMD